MANCSVPLNAKVKHLPLTNRKKSVFRPFFIICNAVVDIIDDVIIIIVVVVVVLYTIPGHILPPFSVT
jgi:hypothetical protein